MNALRRWLSRIAEVGRGRAVDAEMTQEVQSHIDHLTDEYVRRGLPRDAARRAALRDFGAVEGAKESVRDARGIRPLETLVQDTRYAIRLLIKTPTFSIVAILTLALGIGANTAIFSLVDAVILRPLPYERPNRLVSLWEAETGINADDHSGGAQLVSAPTRSNVSPANLIDYMKAPGFSGLAGFTTQALNLTNSGSPERLFGEAVTWNYFSVLSARPAAGRVLLPEDDKPMAAKVIVLSDALWRRRFNADPNIVGRSLTLDGELWTVIGVMPASFRGVMSFAAATNVVEFWVPAAYPADLLANHGDHEINVVGRLRDGVSLETAQAQLTNISQALADAYPQSNKNFRAVIAPLGADLVQTASSTLWAMLAMVALILVIACVNVANLLIVRGVSRKREIAIRLALGAARGRIIRELLTQSLVLAAIGGVLGVFLSVWTRNVLISLAPANTPRLDQVTLDGRVLALCALLVTVTGVLFGILPAWQSSRERPVDALRSTERVVAGTSVMRWRNALMAVEVALSAILLVGAGLTLRSLDAMNSVALGFRTDHVLAMNVSLPAARYPNADARYAFFDKLADRISHVPGVQAVAFANRQPLRGGWSSGYRIGGIPPPPSGFLESDFQAISPGYFAVLDIPLKRGRVFDQRDSRDGMPVAIVSEAFATYLPPGDSPVGHTIQRGPTAPLITILGVVGDVRRGGKLEALQPQVYLPAAQTKSYPVPIADMAVRASGDPTSLVASLQREVWTIDKDQPITNVRTLDDVLFQKGAAQRFRALLFAMCAGLALVLSLVGVYGVVSYAVSQRTPEIGIRMALGADRGRIIRWLVGGTTMLVLGAAAAGLIIARALAHTLDLLLFGVTSGDVKTYAVAAATLCVVAIGSAALAARRGTLIDPAKALRGD
jgi:putative ABC transport system permease protein